MPTKIERANRYMNLSDMGDTVKMLASNFVPDANGGSGLLIKAVPVLKTGQWTDSYAQTPLFYSAKVLEAYAGNWTNNGIYSRHAGGESRAVTDKIGEVRNPRYDATEQGVVADLYYHGLTTASRDTIALINAGMTDAVSVELADQEVFNPDTKRMEATYVRFDGLANVDRGACKTCKIKKNEAKEDLSMSEEDVKKLAEAEKAVAESRKLLEDATSKIALSEKAKAEADAKCAELVRSMASIEEKVKKLEAQEVEQKSLRSTEAGNAERENEEVINADVLVTGDVTMRVF